MVSKKQKRIDLIKKIRDDLINKKTNPNITNITNEINYLASKDSKVEKLTFDQIYRLIKEEKISVFQYKINQEDLLLRIKRITNDFKKPTIQKVIKELNKIENFPRWNYSNFWHYLNDHQIPIKSLGIVHQREGHEKFLKLLITTARNIAQRKKTNQITLLELRQELNLKPAALANRIKRLNLFLEKKKEKNIEEQLAELNIVINRQPAKQTINNNKEEQFLEIKNWLVELDKIEVNEQTDINQEEIVIILQKMFSEIKTETTLSLSLKNNFEKIIQRKKQVINILQKKKRKKQKQLNKKLDLKHFEGSLADKIFELTREKNPENIELIKTALDRLWRMNSLKGKDFDAIKTAQAFLREMNNKEQKK